ncbi:MAG: GNAT family N-acetyltransferase [Phycisphaerales bacterium]
MTCRLEPVTLALASGVARLEPLEMAHAGALSRAASDPAIWRYIPPPYGGASDEASMGQLVERALAAREAGVELPFAIVHRPSGAVVGSTRYMEVQHASRGVEIGATWLGPGWQRTSINTECKYLLLRHAFEALWPSEDERQRGAVRVQLKCDARNVKSQAAILRIGARFEGVLRRHRVLPDGFIRDTAYFSVIREEWPAVKKRLEEMLGLADGSGVEYR